MSTRPAQQELGKTQSDHTLPNGASDRSAKRDEECLKERIVNDLDFHGLPTPRAEWRGVTRSRFARMEDCARACDRPTGENGNTQQFTSAVVNASPG